MNRNKTKKISLGNLYSRFGIFVILLATMIVASMLNPAFFTGSNLLNVLRQNVVVGVIACGAQLVLICGEVDLSPGSLAAFTGCIASMVMVSTQNVLAAAAAGLALGAGFGFLNGIIVTKCRIPSFIMTLATQQIARGAILAITDSKPITGLGDFTWLGQEYIGPVPVAVVLFLIILILTWFILNRLRFGRYMYAVGGNREAAKASGISVDSVKTRAMTFAGIMSALGGIILMSRVNSGQPTGGEDLEFDAITAVIIGGTSMSGGVGNIYGTVAGILFVGVLTNIMTLLDISSYFQQIVQGVIIALAVIIDSRVRNSKKQ